MRILALDAALARCSVGVVDDDVMVAERRVDGARQVAALPAMVQAALAEAGGQAVDLVAVTVGPGSFTGLRAALSLAHGIGLARGVAVVGVTVAEALADALPALGGRSLWVAIDTSRGRIFLDSGAGMRAVRPQDLPPGVGRLAVAGDAAIAVAAALAARGADVMLTDARLPLARHVAVIGRRRAAGDLPPLAAQPLYVDAPEAHPAPQRPPPAR